MSKSKLFPDQIVPLALTVIIFLIVTAAIYVEIILLNKFVVSREKIIPQIRWGDVLIGTTIYLKTAIDFAIFIGRLMEKYPGWKNRVMIEIGTAVGNAVGTMAILLLWDLFREIPLLMAAMIILASLVLFRLAEDGLEHVKDEKGKWHMSFGGLEVIIEKFLQKFNRAVAPVLSLLIPHLSIKDSAQRGFKALFIMSFTVPFILGLDDFAGYIPLFNVVNVYGFAIGVFLGHMVLNLALFISPNTTIKWVKNPIISFLGSLAFIALGLWGLFEALKLLGIIPH